MNGNGPAYQAKRVYKEVFVKPKIEVHIRKCCDTIIIGNLAIIEEYFGHLWGHKATEPMTENQIKWKARWTEVRGRILDNGNNNVRYLIKLISEGNQ